MCDSMEQPATRPQSPLLSDFLEFAVMAASTLIDWTGPITDPV
jgi:hypothetical protein